MSPELDPVSIAGMEERPRRSSGIVANVGKVPGLSQTDITNPKPSASHPREAETTGRLSRWHGVSGSAIALLILPAIMLISGLILIGDMSPIYSGVHNLDYDPAYAYLFNGAGLMKGYSPSLVERPGTPVQLVMGLISIISWSAATLCGLTSLTFPTSIAANPEEYLRVIMTAFLVLNCIAVYWLGAAIARSTSIMVAGIACQSGYLLAGELFPRIFHAAPEAMIFLAATALMTAVAPVIFGNRECSDRRAVVVGLFIGLGTASKATFFPFFLLAFLLRRPRPIFIALSGGVLFMFLFLLPIIDKLKGVFGWLISIAQHKGSYGGGAAGFIDWATIPQRAGVMISTEPLLLAAAVSLAAVILLAKSRDRWTAAVMAVAVGAVIFLTLKHFALHYLMPAVALAPAVIIWASSRFALQRYPYVIAATIALALGIASIRDTSSAFAKERSLRSENEKAVNGVLARYQNPVVIGAYRSGYKPWAVQFGFAWVDKKFARSVPGATADDILCYDAGLKKLWRSDSGALEWSYLDKFERAGRASLVVQSRSNRIEPQTAQTETLLDQGFGDTVERIFISPKTNEK